MTTEDDFQRVLDAKPEDWNTRLVFADWLQDRDDPRAAGYRAIAGRQRRPLQGKHKDTDTWWWHSHASGSDIEDFYNVVPTDWFKLLKPEKDGSEHFWPVFSAKGGVKSRRECEDSLALAFSKLPADRQAELLTPVAPKKSVKVKKPAAKKKPATKPKAAKKAKPKKASVKVVAKKKPTTKPKTAKKPAPKKKKK